MCTPLLSHNSATNNLLLKITVPKRTGRKRKRGSQDPYEEVRPLEDDDEEVQSHSRMDKPSSLLRKLQDTKGSYKIEVAGQITQSHRYRGMYDAFCWTGC
jgi:general transcription factor 3C polypeptide 5 (transcription factor C subunit 1)